MDIIGIYSAHLDKSLIDKLIAQLDAFCDRNSRTILPIKTKGKNGRTLKHFSVFHISRRRSPVLFAGAIEKRYKTQKYPVIRFDVRNPQLRAYTYHTFPYRKHKQLSNKVNLILCEETLASLPRILDSQLTWFTSQYGNG